MSNNLLQEKKYRPSEKLKKADEDFIILLKPSRLYSEASGIICPLYVLILITSTRISSLLYVKVFLHPIKKLIKSTVVVWN